MKLLSENYVYQHFGSVYAHRGDSYQRGRRVSDVILNIETRTIAGQVQGTESRPYTVIVKLAKDYQQIENADCSCPMGGFCKHSAALMLETIRKGILFEHQAAISAERALSTDKAPEKQMSSLPNAAIRPSHRVIDWISQLNSTLTDERQALLASPTANYGSVLYKLDLHQSIPDQLTLSVSQAKRLKTGGWGKETNIHMDRLINQNSQYIREDDRDIARLFIQSTGRIYSGNFPENPELCKIIFEYLLSSRRCYWQAIDGAPLSLGESRQGSLYWETIENGNQKLRVRAASDDEIACIAGVAWYVNPRENIFGPLVLPLPPRAVRAVLNAPLIEPQETEAVCQALLSMGAKIPAPVAKFKIETIAIEPKPKLLLTMYRYYTGGWRESYAHEETAAMVSFDYGQARFKSEETECRFVKDDKIIIYRRELAAEKILIRDLWSCGLQCLQYQSTYNADIIYGFPEGNAIDWLRFCQNGVPKLRELGWTVTVDKSFPHDVAIAEDNWSAETTDGSDFWFSLDLGITVEGRKVPLLPIIRQALTGISGTNLSPVAALNELSSGDTFFAPLPDGRSVALPYERVKALVEILIELFDKDSYRTTKNIGQISLPQVMALANTAGFDGDDWLVGSRLRAILQKIKQFQGIAPISLPKGFRAQLRPYQLEGISWLNFLREFQIGGILADDMGLGKTVQTLAHIAVEKSTRRAKKPFLVVCPTSVLPNWLSEIQKFTPDLKATALWGPERASQFKKIKSSDIVLTTYPLVQRDADILHNEKWQAIFLDEAQMIKNPSTQIAQAVFSLDAQYRVCLTGTPIENHLGELWSQFNFLMPGFLRDLSTFSKTFRTPIEKHKDLLVQKALSSRIRPLLLRRTKEVVASELPEKTEIIKRVELEGAQRDLYETVRLAMYNKVQDALSSKGLAKSQIVILEALLKLRQVCCDPRLVSMPSAKKVQTSAKLTVLLEMLEELFAENKKILLFSQFTSMLDIIVPELEKRKIGFVQIRGDTKDRATPVNRFQNGAVPLFLLSLKAGGFGLNLTAADTVIHYDPWWNPAVENQATDRAHRIGQSKSVFVFKLIAAGTIEERMLELQERKKAIAQGIYDENALPFKLTADDLQLLFNPIE